MTQSVDSKTSTEGSGHGLEPLQFVEQWKTKPQAAESRKLELFGYVKSIDDDEVVLWPCGFSVGSILSVPISLVEVINSYGQYQWSGVFPSSLSLVGLVMKAPNTTEGKFYAGFLGQILPASSDASQPGGDVEKSPCSENAK